MGKVTGAVCGCLGEGPSEPVTSRKGVSEIDNAESKHCIVTE